MNPISTIIKGFSWHSGFKISAGVIAAIKLFALARLLPIEAFGVYALLLVSLGLSEAITQTGINTTLLQAKKDLKLYLSTAWIIAIIRGFIIAGFMIMIGYGLSIGYQDSSLMIYTMAVSVVPIIKGFIHPGIIGFYKKMQFHTDAGYRLSLVIIEALATVSWAIVSPSVWAFVFGLIIAGIFEVCLSFIIIKEKIRIYWDKNIAQEIFANAKSLLPASFLGYVNENIDDVIVGKLTSTNTLGLYHNAFVLSHKPNAELAKSIGHGSFPVYNQVIAEDKDSKKVLWHTMLRSMMFFSILSIPLFVAPEIIIKILLGEKWLEMAPVIWIFTLSGLLHAIAQIIFPFLVANKRYAGIILQFVISILILTSSLIILVPSLGLIGAGISLVVTRIISAIILLIYAHKT